MISLLNNGCVIHLYIHNGFYPGFKNRFLTGESINKEKNKQLGIKTEMNCPIPNNAKGQGQEDRGQRGVGEGLRRAGGASSWAWMQFLSLRANNQDNQIKQTSKNKKVK